MNILIIGAAGMIGHKLAKRLIQEKTLAGQSIDSLTLVDIVEPAKHENASFTVRAEAADLTSPGVANHLVANHPHVIFHLAAIVSGEAERDMPKGYRINLDGTRELLDAIKNEYDQTSYCPKFVFASSIAVYGAPFPDAIDDEFHLTPQSSYGTQKAICELLLADYNRRGIVQGIGLRLPTICIRPGRPNAAASSFFSGILREPINGKPAILPVSDEVRHWFASPRTAIAFLTHAATLEREQIGARCNMNLPGLSATVAEQIEALRQTVGSDAVALIRREHDPLIATMVKTWPESFNPVRAKALGFVAETSFEQIIKVYLDDEVSLH